MSNSKVWVSTGALEGDSTGDSLTLLHASIHNAFRYVYDEIDHETYVRMHSSKIKK